jgi:DnaJ family protein C protein 17
MAASDDLKTHAASSHDFYALLDISPVAVDSEIRRAYRRTALKYHPDKLANPTPADIDKFHLLQTAYAVLSDPSIRQLYDNAREARERKRRENEMLEGVRRKMKEDLEARERGVKRPWAPHGPGGDGESVEDKLEREIALLAEDGKRRRQRKEELMRREILEEEERREREKEESERPVQQENNTRNDHSNTGGTAVPEIDRTVKVRWVREGAGLLLDKDGLKCLFSPFGKIESAFTLKDKKQRVGEERQKKIIATGVVVFSSIVGAHAAVEDSKKQQDNGWDIIESVFWAANKEPDFEQPRPPSPNKGGETTSEPPRPAPTPESKKKLFDFPGLNSAPLTPRDEGKGIKKGPSFVSFSSAGINTAKGFPARTKVALGLNGPSFEEITLIRLKNAERKRLEEQIQKEDEVGKAN